jgi:hypothetical protein
VTTPEQKRKEKAEVNVTLASVSPSPPPGIGNFYRCKIFISFQHLPSHIARGLRQTQRIEAETIWPGNFDSCVSNIDQQVEKVAVET